MYHWKTRNLWEDWDSNPPWFRPHWTYDTKSDHSKPISYLVKNRHSSTNHPNVQILCYMLCVIVLCHARIIKWANSRHCNNSAIFFCIQQASKQVEIDPTAVCDEGKLHQKACYLLQAYGPSAQQAPNNRAIKLVVTFRGGYLVQVSKYVVQTYHGLNSTKVQLAPRKNLQACTYFCQKIRNFLLILLLKVRTNILCQIRSTYLHIYMYIYMSALLTILQ